MEQSRRGGAESAAHHWRTLDRATLLIEVAKDTKFQDGQILTQVAAQFTSSSTTFDNTSFGLLRIHSNSIAWNPSLSEWKITICARLGNCRDPNCGGRVRVSLVSQDKFKMMNNRILCRVGCAHQTVNYKSQWWAQPTLLAVLCCVTTTATFAADEPKPDKWEATIKKFEEADTKTPPAPGGIVFVGSSSIVKWKLSESFPDLPVINRGFGGSQLADSVRNADRIVTPYRPRVVVLYAGDNDIAAGKSPETVRDDYLNFAAIVRAKLPCAKIVYVSIKPSPSRWKLADKVRESNRLIREAQRSDECQVFVDVWPAMLGDDGQPRPELFVADKLHLSPQGYEIWTKLLRPCLVTD